MRRPSVALVVPCHNEVGYVDELLAGLLPQLAEAAHWSLTLIDDHSTDGTARLLDEAAGRHSGATVLRGSYGSPGAARSAGAAHVLAVSKPDWIVTVDADVEVAPGWREAWDATLLAVADHADVGAVNGVELQDHLLAAFPNAAAVSAAFGRAADAGEAAIGITNLNGVNHAIRTAAYLTCGPYVQPTAPSAQGIDYLAGSDWDLGLRVRSAGYRIAATDAAVRDRGRRLLADVHAYVSGDAYEGPFRRVHAAAPSRDVDSHEVAALVQRATERALRHFFFKPLLAGVPVDPAARLALSTDTLAAIDRWIERWPHPTMFESRNGFVFGRLPRFSAEFTRVVQAELGLSPSSGR